MVKKLYHIDCAEGEIGEYCLLPGDPGRCSSIAKHFENAKLVAQNREFVTYTGMLSGKKVSVTSTGIGGPSAAIALEELVQLGAHTFIRIGTCGGINLDVHGGDIVIATGAIRQEGTTLQYAPIEYPALANFDVLSALVTSAKNSGKIFHTGVVQSKDSFYGQHSPERQPVSYELLEKWQAWKRLGVLASEMETAALMVCGNVLNVRVGAVLIAVWNQESDEQNVQKIQDSDVAVKIAIDALKMLF